MTHPSTTASLTPFRLVLHRQGDGTAHFDLFVQADPSGNLPTYELSREAGRQLLRGVRRSFPEAAAQGPITAVQATPSEPAHPVRLTLIPGPESVVATRKADHRAIYWTYTGAISGGRGRIRETLKGQLVDFRDQPELCLSWVGF